MELKVHYKEEINLKMKSKYDFFFSQTFSLIFNTKNYLYFFHDMLQKVYTNIA